MAGSYLYGLRLRLALEEQDRDTCEDYGHHGRERCVVCGIWRPSTDKDAGRGDAGRVDRWALLGLAWAVGCAAWILRDWLS